MRTFLITLSVVLVFGSSAFAANTSSGITDSSRQGASSARPCTGAQLTVRSDPKFSDSAMGGQRGASYIVRNTSRTPCTIKGSPGIVLLDSRGRMMGKRIKPTREGTTTIAGRRQVSFEVGYHSCEFVAGASGRNPKKCRISRTAQIRFYDIGRVFNVPDKLDAEGGIEQVEEWSK